MATTPSPRRPNPPIVVSDLTQRFNRAIRLAPEEQLSALANIRTELVRRYLVAKGNGADPAATTLNVPHYPMRRFTGGDPQLVRRDRHYLKNGHFVVIPATKFGRATSQMSALALFKYIQWRRASIYAQKGDKVGLAGEMAPGWLEGGEVGNGQRPFMTSFDCRRSKLCHRAKAAFEKAFPDTCRTFRHGDDKYYCWLKRDTAFQYRVSKIDRSVFVDTIVNGVSRRGRKGWIIHGYTTGPLRTKMCKGRFESDKIIGITERFIKIQRTTYCAKGIQKTTLDGHKVVFYVNHALPVAPREGDSVRLLVHPKNVLLKKGRKMSTATVHDAIVTEISLPIGYRYRWNQSFDWQLNQPYKKATPP